MRFDGVGWLESHPWLLGLEKRAQNKVSIVSKKLGLKTDKLQKYHQWKITKIPSDADLNFAVFNFVYLDRASSTARITGIVGLICLANYVKVIKTLLDFYVFTPDLYKITPTLLNYQNHMKHLVLVWLSFLLPQKFYQRLF